MSARRVAAPSACDEGGAGGDHEAARSLYGLDEERPELRVAGLGIPRARVLVLEEPFEGRDARILGLLRVAGERRTEGVRVRQEFAAVGELAESLAIAIRRGDRGGPEGAAVIAALERQHP